MTTDHNPRLRNAAELALRAPVVGAVELCAERQPMVWVPGPGNQFVAVPRDTLPGDYLQAAAVATQPRDLSPRPLIDPRAQIVAVSALPITAACWGMAQVISSLAAAGGGVLLGAAALILAARLPVPGGRGKGDTFVTHNHQQVVGRGFLGRASGSITTSNSGRR